MFLFIFCYLCAHGEKEIIVIKLPITLARLLFLYVCMHYFKTLALLNPYSLFFRLQKDRNQSDDSYF